MERRINLDLRKLSPVIFAAIAMGVFAALPASIVNAAGESLPSTSIVPASDGAATSIEPAVPAMPPVPPPPPASAGAAGAPPEEEPNPPPAAESATGATKSKSKSTSHKMSAAEHEVEPAKAQLRLVKDDVVYAEPSKSSKHIERVQSGKFINITGSTRYYLQVRLKNGDTGYLDPSAVEMVKATDKIFTLTHDAPVLEKPNKWSKKLAEVHKPHPVHVVGLALNYARIKMRNGTEGYIPLTALE